MDSSKYIGRVGTLAVALGIGVAMTTGSGIALAETGSGGSDGGTNASKSDNDNSGSTSSGGPKRSLGGPSARPSGSGTGNSFGSGRFSGRPDRTATTTDTGSASQTGSSGTGFRTRLGADNPVKKAIDNAGKRFDRSTERRNVTGGEAKVSPTSSNRIGRLAGRLKGKTNTKQVEAESKPAAPPSDPAGTVAPQSAPIVTTPNISPVATEESPTAAPAPARVIDRVTERFNAGAEKLTPAAKTPSRSTGRVGTSVDDTRSNPLIRPQAPNALPKLSTSSQTVTVALRDTAAATRQQVSALRNIVNIDTAQTLNTASAAPISFANSITAPVSLAGNEAPALPKTTATTVVTSLLTVVGLSPLAGSGGPAVPAQSPLAWALAAWTRRAAEKDVSGENNEVQSAKDGETPIAEGTPMLRSYDIQFAAATTSTTDANKQAPKPTGLPPSLTSNPLGWVTGGNQTNVDPNCTSDCNRGHYTIAGTDLGIMWATKDEDDRPVVMMLFGDSFDGAGMTALAPQGWRNNILFRSGDTDLSDGLQIDEGVYIAGGNYSSANNNWADNIPVGQVIRDPGYNGLFGSTYTIIPTSGIDVDGKQYATIMSVRTWDTPGSWTTNYSAIAVSEDGGKTWTVDKDTVRSSGWLRSSQSYTPGNEHFQQNALVTSNDTDDPYVYVYGTPSGRSGSAYVARVEKDKITDLDSYEYWAGDSKGWVAKDPSAAVAVIGPTETTSIFRPFFQIMDTITFGYFTKIAGGIISGGLPTGGNVSEMSVQYNEYLNRYVVMYTDSGNNVVMRVSESPQGEWSDPITVHKNQLAGSETGMYAPMIHPWSGTDMLNREGEDSVENEQYLYYNLSYWGPYNVQLMRTDLSSVKATLNV